jgi:type VI secretion system secreted protein VgrG
MPSPFDATALLSGFSNAFIQHNRLLVLHFAPASGIADDVLLPHTLSGSEALSTCYRFDLNCLSLDTQLELKHFQGQVVEIGILQSDGERRHINGIVSSAQTLGSDGGFAQFSLTIEPALALLTHRVNSRAFQDKSVVEIVSAILDEQRSANPVFQASFQYQTQLNQTYPSRSYCLQYRESDLAFITRLLREEGISYRFSFSQDGGMPMHTLVLFDDVYSLEAQTQTNIRYHRADSSEESDSITQWNAARSVQSGISTLASFDYQPVTTHQAPSVSRIDQGDAGTDVQSTLESYDPQSAYYGTDLDEMERYARLRQQARDQATKTFTGESTVRSLAPGAWFSLDEHPVHEQDSAGERQFVVTSQRFQAQNNLPAELQEPSETQPLYTNTFSAIRRGIPIVPEYGTEHAKPTAPGVQTATVVGPAGEQIHTDELGRIKLQYHWQRPQDHPEGTASFNDQSSTWVRTVRVSAGGNWGEQAIPRVGQEVLVDFIEGDVDRPIVIGLAHNGRNRPPTFSGVGSLPANKTLSGIKTQEYQGSRYNELLFDDSTGEIRTKLSSEHGKTQLNLGYLIHPRTEGKGEPRGEGAELRTDQAAAIRAAHGILLSADARTHASGKQLDRQELIGLMQVVESLQQQLSELSNTHQAETTDSAKLTQLKQYVENWEHGSNTAPQQSAGGKPIIAATSPAGMVLGSQDNIALAAHSHIDMVSGQSTQISTGNKFLLRATEQISFFVHKLGMKLIAASGKITIQAQNDNVEITAAKLFDMTGLEEIIIQAPKITFITQDTQTVMGGGNITTQCMGVHTEHAGKHVRVGPAGSSLVLPEMPRSAIKDKTFKFDIHLTDVPGPSGEPLPHVGWRIVHASDASEAATISDSILSGQSDDTGQVKLSDADQATLREAYNKIPYGTWLVYGGQARQVAVTPGAEGLNKYSQFHFAADAMAYTDTWQAVDETDGPAFHDHLARVENKATMDQVLDKLKGLGK